MDFQWDIRKAESNAIKHGITFEETLTVFDDNLAITYNDPAHSVGENRYLTFGMTSKGRLVVVCHTDFNNVIRIISSRLMTKRERVIYEEG